MIANKAYILTEKSLQKLITNIAQIHRGVNIQFWKVFTIKRIQRGRFFRYENVHVFVKGCPCNKCALLQGFGRYGQRTPQCHVADAILHPRLWALPPVRALRRFRFHHFEKLVLDGFLGVRIAEAPEYQHGVPSLRHGDAIRGTVGAGYIDFTAFTFQFPLLSRQFPQKLPIFIAIRRIIPWGWSASTSVARCN